MYCSFPLGVSRSTHFSPLVCKIPIKNKDTEFFFFYLNVIATNGNLENLFLVLLFQAFVPRIPVWTFLIFIRFQCICFAKYPSYLVTFEALQKISYFREKMPNFEISQSESKLDEKWKFQIYVFLESMPCETHFSISQNKCPIILLYTFKIWQCSEF
jgi:hypothetical protein